LRYSIPDLQSRSHFQCEALNLINAINATSAINAKNAINAIMMAITHSSHFTKNKCRKEESKTQDATQKEIQEDVV
jgi:hypothetical protein